MRAAPNDETGTPIERWATSVGEATSRAMASVFTGLIPCGACGGKGCPDCAGIGEVPPIGRTEPPAASHEETR